MYLTVKAQGEEIPYWGLRNIVTGYPDSVYENFNPQYIAWGFEWDRLENPDDNFTWSYIDNAVAFTEQYNATAVFLLTPTSSWASNGEPRAPNDLDRTTPLSDPVPEHGYSEALYDYTYKIIDRAEKQGLNTVEYLRYGNEPQYPDHWITTEETYVQDVEDYIRCLITAYIAAHQAADDNNATIKVSHGGFYYYDQLEEIWYDYGETYPETQDSILTLFNSHFERQFPPPITTWDDFKRMHENPSGIPPTYWMDVIAGQTEWLDWFDIHYHFKPRYIFDDIMAFEKAVLDSGGTLKPWLSAEASMQLEAAGETDYEERFHAGDMVRKWIFGMAAELNGICTPVIGQPPERFFGLYSPDDERYMAADAYQFVHSLIQPKQIPTDISGSGFAAYRFHEKNIIDVVWLDALFDTVTAVESYTPIIPNEYADYEEGELTLEIYDILGVLLDTQIINGSLQSLSIGQEPVILIWKYNPSSEPNEPSKYEPPDGYIYHGVGWGVDAQIQYGQMFEENKKPLLYQGITSMPGDTRPFTIKSTLNLLNPSHIDHENQYAEISIHFYYNGEPVDSAFAFTTQYDSYIDTLAEALMINDRPVFLRIGLEMNGPWNGYSPWIFPKAYRKLVEGLRARGIDDVAYVWCYEPDAQADFADSSAEGWKWYPGDDVVDWFGLDLFDSDHFNPAEPDSVNGNVTKKGRSELFVKFAEQRGKPVYLNELSARHVYITVDQNDPGFSDGENDWQSWFEPFFQFLDLHPSVKAFNYIDLDWTAIEQYADWGDARIEINSYIKDKWVEKLADPRFLNIGTMLNGTTGIDSQNEIPTAYELYQNYPNPFNPSTKIEYLLPATSLVKIEVYNILGQKVAQLVNETKPAGLYSVEWNTKGLASGVYIYTINTMSISNNKWFKTAKKMLLLK